MMEQRLVAVGRAEGIAFGFDSTTGNTRDSHRLIEFGRQRGGADGQAQDRIVSALFRMYFEQDGDITSREALLGAAGAAGFDRADARAWLESDAGGPEVDAAVQRAYADGIHGVPNFTINDKYQVDGAQDPEVFLAHFAKIKKAAGAADGQSQATNGSANPSCAPGGQC